MRRRVCLRRASVHAARAVAALALAREAVAFSAAASAVANAAPSLSSASYYYPMTSASRLISAPAARMHVRQAPASSASSSSIDASSLSHAHRANHSSVGIDRHVIQSLVNGMDDGQLIHFDNTSSITISTIIAVLCVLIGVFLACIVVAAILSKINAPRQEAFPWAQETGPRGGMYQPSHSASDKADSIPAPPSAASDLNNMDASFQENVPLAGGGSNGHFRTGSSGLGFPGPATAAHRKSPLAAQYQERQSSPSGSPNLDPRRGTVNYNGREMTINMAGPLANENARQAAEDRLGRERTRRSTVIGGPPPLADGRRVSRYSRASMTSGTRLSLAAARKSFTQRKSRARLSRLSGTSDDSVGAKDAGGYLSSRRKAVTSTGAGMVRSPSSRMYEEEGPLTSSAPYDREGLGNTTDNAMRFSKTVSRPPALSPFEDTFQAHPTGLLSAESGPYDHDTDVYATPEPQEWAAAQASQADLLDPLHVHRPQPYVTTRG